MFSSFITLALQRRITAGSFGSVSVFSYPCNGDVIIALSSSSPEFIPLVSVRSDGSIFLASAGASSWSPSSFDAALAYLLQLA